MHNNSNFQLIRTSCTLLLPFVFISILACSRRAPSAESETQSATKQVVDEAGRQITLPVKVERIVSLAPNLTEIVYAVGAGDRLVGNTEYCDYPVEAKSVTKIGDTMHPSVERIIALKPQLVLVSTASQLEAFTKQLDQQRIAVYVTNPHSLDEIFHSITVFGELFDRSAILALVRKRCDRQGTSALVVTHDINLAAEFSNRILLMKDGRSVAFGETGSSVGRLNERLRSAQRALQVLITTMRQR